MKPNRITELFGIQYPVIAGGMVWCSGWRLAAAVSNAGGLGLLGAGSMHPETLIEHIDKMNAATDKPWGINLKRKAASSPLTHIVSACPITTMKIAMPFSRSKYSIRCFFSPIPFIMLISLCRFCFYKDTQKSLFFDVDRYEIAKFVENHVLWQKKSKNGQLWNRTTSFSDHGSPLAWIRCNCPTDASTPNTMCLNTLRG